MRKLREGNILSVYARRGCFWVDANHTLFFIYKGVHNEEHFACLPFVLFNSAVVLKSCLVNLSMLLLYLWSWITLSAIWEQSGVSDLLWRNCPFSPQRILPLSIYLHTYTKTYTFNWHPLMWWTQCHVPFFSKTYILAQTCCGCWTGKIVPMIAY